MLSEDHDKTRKKQPCHVCHTRGLCRPIPPAGKELGSILLRHRIKKKNRIQYPHCSGFIAYSKIFTLKSEFKKFQIHRIRTSRLKPYPERKKLWIQTYPDTCGRGLIIFILFKTLTCSPHELCLQGFFKIPSLFYSNLINDTIRI